VTPSKWNELHLWKTPPSSRCEFSATPTSRPDSTGLSIAGEGECAAAKHGGLSRTLSRSRDVLSGPGGLIDLIGAGPAKKD
jgi:hypothetical protein